MRHGKSLLAAVVVLAGLATSASAQGFGAVGGGGNAFAGGFGIVGGGFNQGFGGFNNFGEYNGGFNNGGFYPGAYNNYGVYNGGYGNYVPRPIPQTQNNMFGLMNSIRTQTGGGNSYRYGYGPAVGGRRR